MENPMSSPGSAPPVGATVTVPATVASVWSHATVIIAGFMAAIPAIIAILVQLKELPGLPTNVLAWVTTAITVLGGLATLWAKLHGAPTITPTMAAKAIASEPSKGN
jgi:hypothetical protein